MKNIKKLIVLVALTIFASCDNTDLNIDPTRPQGGSVDVAAIIPVMQTQTHRNIGALGGRLAGIVMQHWAGFDAQQVAYTQYNIGEGDIAALWEGGLYVGAMKDCDDIINRTTLNDNFNTRGMAKVYMAFNLGMATDLWGDIPYTESFKDDNLTPSYDTQSDVYATIQRLLDEAIADLEATDAVGFNSGLTGGSAANWVMTAHALKARYLLHMSKRDATVYNDVLSEVAEAFTSNDEQPAYIFDASTNGRNPISAFGAERPNTMIIAPSFATLMDGDPRKGAFMVENADGDFLFYQSGNKDLFYAQQDSPAVLISYSELKFIEAEALLQTGGDALTALREAVTANMEFVGALSTDITTYVGALALTGTTEEQLETIITEKYKAFYGLNPIEAWNDYRRTGYPNLTPDANGVNGNNPSGVLPLRFLYPDSERLANSANYEAAINNQGGHLLDDALWIWQ